MKQFKVFINEAKYDFTMADEDKADISYPKVKDQATAEFILKKTKIKWDNITIFENDEEIYIEDGDESDVLDADFEKNANPEEVLYRMRNKVVATWDIGQDELIVKK